MCLAEWALLLSFSSLVNVAGVRKRSVTLLAADLPMCYTYSQLPRDIVVNGRDLGP